MCLSGSLPEARERERCADQKRLADSIMKQHTQQRSMIGASVVSAASFPVEAGPPVRTDLNTALYNFWDSLAHRGDYFTAEQRLRIAAETRGQSGSGNVGLTLNRRAQAKRARLLGPGSQRPAAGSLALAGCRILAAACRKKEESWKLVGREFEAGSRNSEAADRKSEAASRKSKAAGAKSEAASGSLTSDFSLTCDTIPTSDCLAAASDFLPATLHEIKE